MSLRRRRARCCGCWRLRLPARGADADMAANAATSKAATKVLIFNNGVVPSTEDERRFCTRSSVHRKGCPAEEK